MKEKVKSKKEKADTLVLSRIFRLLSPVSCLLSLFLCVSAVFSQSGGAFTITKSVIAGGGGRASGGTFTVDGTIGQSLAGTSSTGGAFTIISGFWGGAASTAMGRRTSVSSVPMRLGNGGSIAARPV